MRPKNVPEINNRYACETCKIRMKCEANPKTWLARLWKWHTTWCPGWASYQAHLAELTYLLRRS